PDMKPERKSARQTNLVICKQVHQDNNGPQQHRQPLLDPAGGKTEQVGRKNKCKPYDIVDNAVSPCADHLKTSFYKKLLLNPIPGGTNGSFLTWFYREER